jgi:hypothetical protein
VWPSPDSTAPRAFRIYSEGAALLRLSIRPSAINAIAVKATTQSGKPVKGSVPPPIAPVALRTPFADSTLTCVVLIAGLALADVLGTDGELADDADAGVLPAVFGRCAGSPTWPGSGVECGGEGGCVPQAVRRFPFRACTSTS